MGESTSDYFVHRFTPQLAVIGGGVVFAIVLAWQLLASTYVTARYWAAVVMVSVFGTMCADVVHVALGVPYIVSAVTFAIVLAAVFLTWSRTEGTLSIHSILSTRRELFYWATVTVTFALGTAVGDLTAYTANLGFLGSGVLFAVLFSLPGIAFALWRRNPILMFWCAYVLTRPLGASFADWFGKPRTGGGLGWGPGTVALSLGAVIVVAVALDALREGRDKVAR